jgi:hypothetical protein
MVVPWNGELFCVRSVLHPNLISYNPAGFYRFSPTDTPDYAAYFGTSIEAALTETILRAGIPVLTGADLEGRILRVVRPEPLQLFDITGPHYARSKDITAEERAALVMPRGSEERPYAVSRKWAGKILRKYPDIAGIRYQSVQDLDRHAVAIYASRLAPGSALHDTDVESLPLASRELLPLVLRAAQHAGVVVAQDLLDRL